MGTSSNFGNMFSAAGASLFLPFLPMLPVADPAQQPALRHQPADHPHRPRRRGAARPPVALGHRGSSAGSCSSSARSARCSTSSPSRVMLWVLHAGPAQFRTGWFVESLATQTLVIFAIRTRRIPFFRSRPSRPLLAAAAAAVAVAWLIRAAGGRAARLPPAAGRLPGGAGRAGGGLPGAGRGRQAGPVRLLRPAAPDPPPAGGGPPPARPPSGGPVSPGALRHRAGCAGGAAAGSRGRASRRASRAPTPRPGGPRRSSAISL